MIKNIFVFTYNTETSIIVSNILKENKKKARPHVTKKNSITKLQLRKQVIVKRFEIRKANK